MARAKSEPSRTLGLRALRARAAWRDWWLKDNGRCMLCGSPAAACEVHEIERRSQAPKRWAKPENYLALCPTCHAEVGRWSHARQLALKLLRDPWHFDLDGWLRIRDPQLMAPERVTLQEVVDELCLRENATQAEVGRVAAHAARLGDGQPVR